MKPDFDYSHVLNELSVNRKDPCEVIRELVSNAYDAGASKIWMVPLLQYNGFLFVDNGSGICHEESVNGIVPWCAFFSIGKSTKRLGEGIGYKCQGSKLCFASKEFVLVTRAKAEEDSAWQWIHLDNPKVNLNVTTDISPRQTNSPLEPIAERLERPDERSSVVLELLGPVFSSLKTGTVVLVKHFEAAEFNRYFGGSGSHDYLREYVKFSTRHGDVRVLRPAETGFPSTAASAYSNTRGFRNDAVVYLMRDKEWCQINVGYPYLPAPDGAKLSSRLRDGRFASRHATQFRHAGRSYSLILAIDGNRRALDGYPQLDRQGRAGSRSGMKLTEQRGTFVCAEGIKVSSFNQIFDQPSLSDYEVLASTEAQAHYAFFIDGSFELVTNRNSLSEDSLRILIDREFCEKVQQFFQRAERENEIFRGLLERLRRETEVHRLEKYLQVWHRAKESLHSRERFRCTALPGKTLLAPIPGEEHWVAALYTLFSHLVDSETPLSELWLVPRTYSSVGIDCIAAASRETSLTKPHHGLEFKFSFAPRDGFNHPLIETTQIVAWQLDSVADGDQLRDDFQYFGTVRLIDALKGLGYQVVGLESDCGDTSDNVITVLSLRELLARSFGVTFTAPLQRSLPSDPIPVT